MGDGWRLDFSPTYFDTYSPPDFYTKVSEDKFSFSCCFIGSFKRGDLLLLNFKLLPEVHIMHVFGVFSEINQKVVASLAGKISGS